MKIYTSEVTSPYDYRSANQQADYLADEYAPLAKAVGGEAGVGHSFSTGPSCVLLILPDEVDPHTVVPDRTWTEQTQ